MLRGLVVHLLRVIAGFAVAVVYRVKYYAWEQLRRAQTRSFSGSARHDTGLWCVFAHRQGKTKSENQSVFLAGLNEVGYNIVLVNNGPLSPSLVDAFVPQCHTVIAKSYGGRDFGCYQYGTKVLRELAGVRPVSQVIYCNESVFVRPSRLPGLLQRVRESQSAYIGVTGSFEGYYHVSSWFFAVSGELFNSTAFGRFWNRYKPFSSRMHAIRRGEIGLSAYLQSQGFDPEILFNPKNVLDAFFAVDSLRLDEAVNRLTSAALWRRIGRSLPSIDGSTATTRLEGSGVRELLRRVLANEGELRNNTNLYNLIMLEFCDFPFLKKDLVYRNQYHLIQIQEVLDKWGEPDNRQVPEIVGSFRLRGTTRRLPGIKGLLIREGFI